MNDIKENFLNLATWVRVALVVLFFWIVLCFLLPPVVGILAFLQLAYALFTGEPNERLQEFSASLNIYLLEVLDYVSFVSDSQPFPFSDYPMSNSESASRRNND